MVAPPRRAGLLPVLLSALLPILTPGRASAHALEPRTPVDWSGAPCMTTIARWRDGPIHQLHYAIPKEDTALTDNEPADGRRHQFLGFCRDHYYEDVAPQWISEADLNVALDLGLGDISLVDLEHDVLDNALRWQDCFVRITADDARRPISFAAAAEPVAWDTTALPAGTYVVEAYTWDPWFNLWTEHPGVFRLVDDPDPAANPPAAALIFDEQVVSVGDEATIGGCVEAMPGSTMTLSWALGGTGAEPIWQVHAADVPVESGALQLSLPGPAEAVGRYLLVAVEVVDPLGRRWTAHGRSYIGVVPGAGDSGDSDESGDTGESEGTSDAGTTDDTGLETSEGGCGCNQRGSTFPSVMLLGLTLLLLGSRRRS